CRGDRASKPPACSAHFIAAAGGETSARRAGRSRHCTISVESASAAWNDPGSCATEACSRRGVVGGRDGGDAPPEARVALQHMTDSAAIEVTGPRKIFQQTDTGLPVVAIDRLDFAVRRGDIVAIVGQTGATS